MGLNIAGAARQAASVGAPGVDDRGQVTYTTQVLTSPRQSGHIWDALRAW